MLESVSRSLNEDTRKLNVGISDARKDKGSFAD